MGSEREDLRATSQGLAPASILSRQTAQEHRTRIIWGTILQESTSWVPQEPAFKVRWDGDGRCLHRTFARAQLPAASAVSTIHGHFDWRRSGKSDSLSNDQRSALRTRGRHDSRDLRRTWL